MKAKVTSMPADIPAEVHISIGRTSLPAASDGRLRTQREKLTHFTFGFSLATSSKRLMLVVARRSSRRPVFASAYDPVQTVMIAVVMCRATFGRNSKRDWMFDPLVPSG